MEAPTDAEILNQFRAGDREGAFQLLVETHGKAVYNIALFTLNDEVLAEDATQDAFIRIYRGLEKYQGRSSLSTWMYRIVKNVCYDQFKRRRTLPLDQENQAGPGRTRSPVFLPATTDMVPTRWSGSWSKRVMRLKL